MASDPPLNGIYAQYRKADKHWYAPNMFEAYGQEEIDAVMEVLRDGWLAPGPKTERFESEVAKLFDKEHGLMVNSGSSGNLLALDAFGFQPGDEVVSGRPGACPPHSTLFSPSGGRV